jgi:uncharacterized membrane protein
MLVEGSSLRMLLFTAALSIGCGGDDAGPNEASCDELPRLTYASFGRGFVSEYCASCHAQAVVGADRRGAPALLTLDTLAQIRENSAKLNEQVVVDKTMPFGSASKKPSDDEREDFGVWLRCGAPE